VGVSFTDDDIERIQDWARRHREVVISPAEARLLALASVFSPPGTRIAITGRDAVTGLPVHTSVKGSVLLTVLGRDPATPGGT
jgi:hypothetical protein